MILKLYKFTENNWLYIDNITRLNVSEDGEYCLKKFEEISTEIQGILNNESSINTWACGDNPKNYYCLYNNNLNCLVNGWGYFLFSLRDLIKLKKYPNKLNIKFIEINRPNEDKLLYIISREALFCKRFNTSFAENGMKAIGYILNDNGKTIERL